MNFNKFNKNSVEHFGHQWKVSFSNVSSEYVGDTAVQNKDLEENTKIPSLSNVYMQPILVLECGMKGFNADQ